MEFSINSALINGHEWKFPLIVLLLMVHELSDATGQTLGSEMGPAVPFTFRLYTLSAGSGNNADPLHSGRISVHFQDRVHRSLATYRSKKHARSFVLACA